MVLQQLVLIRLPDNLKVDGIDDRFTPPYSEVTVHSQIYDPYEYIEIVVMYSYRSTIGIWMYEVPRITVIVRWVCFS